MRSLKEIWRFARSSYWSESDGVAFDTPYNPPVPSPYDVALALIPALVTGGKYETPDAAVAAAWWLVPDYYLGAAEYNNVIAPARFTNPGIVTTDTSDDIQKKAEEAFMAGEMHNTETHGV